MATLWITQYAEMTFDGGGHRAPAPKEPAIDVQALSFTSTSAQSAVFHPRTRIVLLTADADCHVAFGDDPVARATHQPVWAMAEVWRGVDPGMKLAVIEAE